MKMYFISIKVHKVQVKNKVHKVRTSQLWYVTWNITRDRARQEILEPSPEWSGFPGRWCEISHENGQLSVRQDSTVSCIKDFC